MIKVNVLSEEISWNKKIKNKQVFFDKIIKNFPKKYRFSKKNFYLTLLLSNNKNIKLLNKKFKKKNKHTDILSFPFENDIKKKKETYLGDIIISYDYINNKKKMTKLQFQKKTIKLFIHGFLHLLGFDHLKNKDYKKMYIEEEKIFKSLSKKFN